KKKIKKNKKKFLNKNLKIVVYKNKRKILCKSHRKEKKKFYSEKLFPKRQRRFVRQRHLV
ncbi:hypothetical protein, partial [Escherichia coli]|uniref:hypothetical protein n=1 Tax=Escherichia coli TaxID=562 RepID=UPI0035E42F3E